ncbi:MAG: hypothetical protein JXB25_05525 [Deltaproteobacteria bacterium]|nr:hypothetical protein [Deltaproteobacteria bacterium]
MSDKAAAVVRDSMEGLSEALRRHRELLTGLIEEGLDPGTLEKAVGGRSPAREGELRRALAEAIEVLEESRSAFKSKRLEALRKKLMQVLMAD